MGKTEGQIKLEGLSDAELESNKRILFLDDRSKRIHSALKKFGSQVTIVCTVKECIKMLSNQEWDIVYLDHDLNFEEFVDSDRKDCGMEVVRYLRQHCGSISHLENTVFIIHSSNMFAAQKMVEGLKAINLWAGMERWQYE